VSEALGSLRAGYQHRYAAARHARAAGRRVVGYFQNTVPVELIRAAGLFPVRLAGSPEYCPPVVAEFMEEYFDGEVRSIFGLLAEGHFDFVDLVVIPRSAEIWLQLYYLLLEFREWRPDAPVPAVYLFDLLQSPHYETGRYVLGRCRDLARQLAEVSGTVVTEAALVAAIAKGNRQRRLLQLVSAQWQSAKPTLDGADALRVIGSAGALGIERHCELLERLLDSLPPSLSRHGPRLLLKGSPQSDTRFTELVEAAGGAVVAHDHAWGDRTYQALIAETGDPWEALAEHYWLEAPSPRSYPQEREDQRFLALAQAAAVDGVIFWHEEWDDTLGWEYPGQKRLLDAAGIGSLYLKRQPYFEPPVAAQRQAVSDFLAALRTSAATRRVAEGS
jgi:benzoyl-CoA reductase/2-hydroxyglutaryl-CoA dehydratase subunit BcrC/BadD/HgdB